MLHESGTPPYDAGIRPRLPWLLHEPAHMLATEAIAMLFGRLVRDAAWLAAVAAFPSGEADRLRAAAPQSQAGAMLVFARLGARDDHFERGLYEQPTTTHDRRCGTSSSRFQLVRRPDGRHAPDWAAKIHLAVAPVYYQNYLYGELLPRKLHARIQRDCDG